MTTAQINETPDGVEVSCAAYETLQTKARIADNMHPIFADILKSHFPWLGTDEDAGSGADVMRELAELHQSLDSKTKENTSGKRLERELLQQSSEKNLDLIDLGESGTDEYPLYEPCLVWSKPLTPCGPDSDPLMRLLGTVYILGVMFHAEAYEVEDRGEDEQTGLQDESETYLSEILNIVQGAANTITIAGRQYVLAITPSQR